jgi:hypothetical protein
VSKPVRIQRQRTKGYRTPPNTVYVGRSTRWGNPYIVGNGATAAQCVALYRLLWTEFLDREPDARERLKRNLGGKNLSCWCALDKPCHADVLLEMANR